MSFEPTSIPIAQLAWERFLGFPDGSFSAPGRPGRLSRISESTDSASFLRLFDLNVLIGPQWLLERAESLGDDQLHQDSALLSLGLDHGAQSMGSAELLLADDLDAIATDQQLVVSLAAEDASRLFAACPPDDVNASGLLQSTDRFTVVADDLPIATSGYQELAGLLAGLGVLVHPEARHRGHALAAAGIAAHEALAAGLIPLWQAATDNPASRRLADKLGFHPVGTLTTLRLSGGTPAG